MTRVNAIVAGALAVAFAPRAVVADDDADRGKEIAQEAEKRARGFGNYQAEMEMTLSDRRGETTVRKLEVATLEVSNDADKSLVYFHSPRDIRGTALLTYSFRDQEDDQWLYLPALRRTKRIAAGNRSSPFMGSELSYEDLASVYVDDYTYTYVGEETFRKTACYVIERVPTYDGTGYSKQKVWLDKQEYRVLQIEYWDTRGRKLKTLALGRYEQYLDEYWMAGEARMLNHQTKASTRLVWSNYRFHAGLKDSDFSKSALRRAR